MRRSHLLFSSARPGHRESGPGREATPPAPILDPETLARSFGQKTAWAEDPRD